MEAGTSGSAHHRPTRDRATVLVSGCRPAIKARCAWSKTVRPCA